MEFDSYADARKHYAIDDTVYCINIVDHPGSYESIRIRGNIIKAVGIGRMKSPGHPGSNQSHANQRPIFNQCKKNFSIPVFNTLRNGKVRFMGRYIMQSFKNVRSLEGFSYYEFTLLRFSYRYDGIVLHVCI